MQFRLEKVLRIMREFMTHSNQATSSLADREYLSAQAQHPDSLPFDYSVTRAKRKTMVIHVRHASVEVRAPLFVSVREIREFVTRHRAWVEKKLSEKAGQDAQRLMLTDGGTIFYKARSLTVRYISDTREAIVITEREFCIHGPRLNDEVAARILQRWLLLQARTVLPARAKALAGYLQAGGRLKEVVFRKTKTKWGHCTSSGRIQFNWLIMLAPDAIIDYMICHEVSHLLHMNHSRRFWAVVESVCPDYRIYVKWLKKHEHRLWL